MSVLETWNPRLEVSWNSDEKIVLDESVLLTQQSGQVSYLDRVLQFLYKHTGAEVVMVCRKTKEEGKMQVVRIFYQGQALGINPMVDLEGTPCANLNRHGVLYFPSKVQKLFPRDLYLQEYGINSYFGAPLMDSNNELIGTLAILHQKPLPNPNLLEFVITILSPSLEILLEKSA
ncbi:GAF domain-containing protein [Sabulibacter ruber]|uniref:GAF domain-containing protein n=1 Tax=Sabulibacter ruber TaxID=2811901 RepID=UPI001A9638DF|nr:GAF domain-containing protein [Sabulibacter ruber]